MVKRLPFDKNKKRKISLKGLKKKSWVLFSEWVRRRFADSVGIVSCITCGAKIHWKQANASHFIHGHGKPTFLDERNVHASCVRCNLYLSGNLVEYAAFMQKTYGWDTVDALRELSHQVVKFNREYYEGFIAMYADKLEELNAKNTEGKLPAGPNGSIHPRRNQP